MRLNVRKRLLIVLVAAWLLFAGLVIWAMRPVVDIKTGISMIMRPNPFWQLSYTGTSLSPHAITSNISATLVFLFVPVVVLLLVFAAVAWVARGAHAGNA